MINLIFGHLLCITAKVFGIMNGLCLKSGPRCMLCYRLPPYTCALLIEEPTPLRSHSLCDCLISSLESLVFWIVIRLPRVYHGHIVGLHLNTSEERSVGLFSIPSEFQYGSASFGLILNWRMLQISYIELPNTAVCSYWCKDISFFGKMYIINLFIMCYKLGEDSGFFDIPNSTGCIDGACSD